MSDTLVKVDNLSKKFCRSLKRSLWYGMQDLGSELVGRRHGGDGGLRPDEFWAVNNVSFELKRGECLGLIGRNGAGKTTLLRMLNGLIKPDAGRVEMRGRVGALIALGAGFNPILTGRENIYVNAAVLGLSKRETDRQFDEIVEFAELGQFIDAPVQTYSSGMSVRLGFAISTTLQPEILILDEVLAVGDAAFRHKCYQRLSTLFETSAVIIVSHDMNQIAQVASKILFMQRGSGQIHADVLNGISAYSHNGKRSSEKEETEEYKSGNIGSVTVSYDQDVAYGSYISFQVEIASEKEVRNVDARCVLFSQEGAIVADSLTRLQEQSFLMKPGQNILTVNFGPIHLIAGHYKPRLVLLNRETNEHLYWGVGIGTVNVYDAPVYGQSNYAPTIGFDSRGKESDS